MTDFGSVRKQLQSSLTAADGQPDDVGVEKTFWTLGGDVNSAYTAILRVTGPDGRTVDSALLLVEKGSNADATFLGKIAAPNIASKGKYKFKGTEAEAIRFVRARDGATDAERPVLVFSSEQVAELMDMIDAAKAAEDAPATTGTSGEPSTPPREASEFVPTLEHPAPSLPGKWIELLVKSKAMNMLVTSLVNQKVGEALHALPQIEGGGNKRLRAEAGSWAPPPPVEPIVEDPYGFISDNELESSVDPGCVAVVQNLTRGTKTVTALVAKLFAVCCASGAWALSLPSAVVSSAFLGDSLFLRFQSRMNCEFFISGMKDKRNFEGKDDLWKKIAWYKPPNTYELRKGPKQKQILEMLKTAEE